jgi:replication factor C small subunit
MDLFETKNKTEVEEHTIWAEKYRPNVLTDYVGNSSLKETVARYIKTNDIPHLLFFGKAGTGKTTLAKLIASTLKCDALYINASDQNNVDNVRTKIKDFAANAGLSALKIVILDEADFLTHSSQAALRNMIESYSRSTRFILTCNYFEKISEPLFSRCQCYEITPMTKKDVAIHLKNILAKEKVSHTMEDIGYIVNTYYPDIRKVINFSQQSTIDGIVKITELQSSAATAKNKILEVLKSTGDKNTKFLAIRQLVADSGIRHFEELYELLFEKVNEYASNNQSVAILIVAEYLYQSSMVVNKEIMFMACISKLLSEL